MEFYIDLRKGVLNFAKLVKKAVQVKGKNGKVFTRMQWVSPLEASTGMGVRKINSKHGLNMAINDGMHKHPDFQHALNDQGLAGEPFEDHHPHFFLPETEESYNKRQDRLNELDAKDKWDELDEDRKHSQSYGHEDKIPHDEHKLYDEHEFVHEDSDIDDEAFMQKHDIHPEIHNIIKTIIDPLDEDIMRADGYGNAHQPHVKLMYLSDAINNEQWGTITKHISDHIKATVKDDTFVRNVQLEALKNGDMRHTYSVAHHPVIARAVVNKILGRGLADRFREDMKDGNLSINFPGMHEEAIKRDGYIASTMENYVKTQLDEGEEKWEQLQELMEDDSFGTEKERIDAIDSLGRGFGDVSTRAMAEYQAVGITMEDRKPSYIAFNPLNNDRGAAQFYGNKWLKVDEGVLNHCTATFDDSFNTSKSVAKVHSMDHLKDMFLLKAIDKQYTMGDIIKNGPDRHMDWHGFPFEIPIELQYHQPKLDPSQFTIIGEEQQSGEYDDLDDDPEWEDYTSEPDSDEDYISDDTDYDDLDFDDDDLEEWED